MSKYTTGEVAKLCGITVRTVQYYDSRNILSPSELSEGGRRLYSDDDLRMMKIICFLRDAGLSLNGISTLLKEDDPESVISVLIHEQEESLRKEAEEIQIKRNIIEEIKRGIKNTDSFSVESIGDIAYSMTNKEKLKKLHGTLLLTGIPVSILEAAAIITAVVTKRFWLLLIYVLIAIPYGIIISKYYFKHVAYICPKCHKVFKPKIKEAFFARHTPTLRKLTCPHCEHNGFCVEIYNDSEKTIE